MSTNIESRLGGGAVNKNILPTSGRLVVRIPAATDLVVKNVVTAPLLNARY